jgi:hypothetical protein
VGNEKRPEWFPWDDDPSNENGWYGRHEAEAYFDYIETRRNELVEQVVDLGGEVHELNASGLEDNKRITALESRLQKAREALEFYAQPHVWGIAFPGECTSIESIDEWNYTQPNGEISKRGGKRAREALAEIWPDSAGGKVADEK